jgi:hypothetical protein
MPPNLLLVLLPALSGLLLLGGSAPAPVAAPSEATGVRVTCHPGGGDGAPSGVLRGAAEILAQGQLHPDRATRLARFTHVQEAADARIHEAPDDLDARWWRVAALGLRIDHESPRQKVILAGVVRREAEEILTRDADHPGGHHALGRLHSGVLRLNPVLRFLALRLFGEAELGNATWADAEVHMQRAKAAVPCALIHRYELSRSFAYQRKYEEALAELDALLALPDRAPQDPQVRSLALALRERVEKELG